MGVGDRTLPLERSSVFEGVSCCCEGPASLSSSDELAVAACDAAEEPALFLRHLWHLFLNPPLVFSRLYWPHSHNGASGSTLMGLRGVYLLRLATFPVRTIESATTVSTIYKLRPMYSRQNAVSVEEPPGSSTMTCRKFAEEGFLFFKFNYNYNLILARLYPFLCSCSLFRLWSKTTKMAKR